MNRPSFYTCTKSHFCNFLEVFTNLGKLHSKNFVSSKIRIHTFMYTSVMFRYIHQRSSAAVLVKAFPFMHLCNSILLAFVVAKRSAFQEINALKIPKEISKALNLHDLIFNFHFALAFGFPLNDLEYTCHHTLAIKNRKLSKIITSCRV